MLLDYNFIGEYNTLKEKIEQKNVKKCFLLTKMKGVK